MGDKIKGIKSYVELRIDTDIFIKEAMKKFPDGHDFTMTCSKAYMWHFITYCRNISLPIELVHESDDGNSFIMSTAATHYQLEQHELRR